jgi:CRISPR-associated protein Cst2
MAIELTDIERNAKFNFMEITFLTKVEKSILNAAGNYGGNLTELKKTTEIDGTQRVFVSGSSIKWSIKQYWKENQDRTGEKISPQKEKGKAEKNGKNKSTQKNNIDKEQAVASTNNTQGDEEQRESQISSACDPETYIDDDLFGYFDTGMQVARNAPVKTSGMISLFSTRPDVDNLVRLSERLEDHSLFDKEISTNIFRSSWAIELDRIGVANAAKKELKSKDKSKVVPDVDIPSKIKEKRVKLLLEAIFNLWQRTQQTNYLTNTQPQLMTVVFRNDKSLIVGDKLTVDQQYKLNIEPLREILQYHGDRVALAYVASHKSFISNYIELQDLINDEDLKGRVFVSDMIQLKQKLLSDEFKFITPSKFNLTKVPK